jgi:hypothetical protein
MCALECPDACEACGLKIALYKIGEDKVMLIRIRIFLWNRPFLMANLALVMAVALVLSVMWIFGELPENPMNKLNILRDGIGIPRQ